MKPGITARATIKKWYDGDTCTIELRLPFRVRLTDCWAPEIRTRDADEKQRGQEAKEFVEGNWPPGTEIMAHVDTSGADRADDVLTFGRVLAELFNEKGLSINKAIVAAGHATVTKQQG